MRTWNIGSNVDKTGRIVVEPDLREEFKRFIYGGSGELTRGHWIVFRKSDLSQRSQFWNAETKEAVGGPPFVYADYLVKARYKSFTSGQEEYRDISGLVDRPIKTYYLDYRLKPKKEDYIIEITSCDNISAPTGFKATQVYDIILVDEPRDEHGRIEYYVCMCQGRLSRGDTTLENFSITETL